MAFIQGRDENIERPIVTRMNALAAEEKFEEAELVKRQLEKVQRSRKEVKDKLPSIWGFDYLVLLPSDSTARTKVAFIRAGSIVGFEDFDTSSLADSIPIEVARRFSDPADPIDHNWQYDEFCLVANYLVHPLKSVELVRLEAGMDLAGYLKKRQKRPPSSVSEPN
jgi:CRISPR/Cas system-associated exonuclease Cas4 (RecB family)